MFVPMLTDSHTHLYLDAFDADREEAVRRAVDAGVSRMFLPNIDEATLAPMLQLCRAFPGNLFPMMGLHPTSVKREFRRQLETIGDRLDDPGIIAIGEVGIDLYWDRSHRQEQEEAFRTQISWALDLGLPLVIHARESFQEIFGILDRYRGKGLTGVFHSFTGGLQELEKALGYGFKIGINGIVTFRNSRLDRVVREIPPQQLLIETDSPFLAPVPERGKRNESSYLVHIASKVGEILRLTSEQVARITTENAFELFQKAVPHEG